MRDDELAMLKTAKEIVERELWEKHKKGSLELGYENGDPSLSGKGRTA